MRHSTDTDGDGPALTGRVATSELVSRLTVPGTPRQALTVSLDLDVELQIGAAHRLRTRDLGAGYRTGGPIAAGERVAWAARVWGLVPVRHTSLIVGVHDRGDEGACFTDAMQSGLFVSFQHVHDFTSAAPAADGTPRTLMHDRIEWVSPLGPMGRVADAVFVRRVLSQLLHDRNAAIAARLGDLVRQVPS